MQDYHDLLVWKRAKELVILVYQITKSFPVDELYGLTSQLRRAAVSVLANIVEGRGKLTIKDFLRYLFISKGSLNECQCYFELALDLKYINEEQFNVIEKKRGEAGYLLYQLIKSLS